MICKLKQSLQRRVKTKVKILIRTMSECLSPAPGRHPLDVAIPPGKFDAAISPGNLDVAIPPGNLDVAISPGNFDVAISPGKFSLEERTKTISFEERRVSTASENGIMTAVDLIVVKETTFVNPFESI